MSVPKPLRMFVSVTGPGRGAVASIACVLAFPLILASAARADDRPSENEMFGAPVAKPDGGTQTDGAPGAVDAAGSDSSAGSLIVNAPPPTGAAVPAAKRLRPMTH